MAAANKVGWAQLRVGLMALVALVILIFLIFLLTGADNPFEPKAYLYTYMSDSAALSEGTAVRLNGILIGKVKSVELSGEKDNNRAIRMKLQLDERYRRLIPNDSLIAFSAENVLGAKFLNIKRGNSPTPIVSGGELKARDEKDFLEIMQSAMPLLESLQSILGRIDKVVAQVESGRGSIGKLLYDETIYNRVDTMLIDVQKVTRALSEGKGTAGRLLYDEALYNDLHRTLMRVDSIAEGLQNGEGTAGKMLKETALYDDLRKASAELSKMISEINEGKGTAGKLLKDDALHKRLIATLDNLNGTVDKINAGQGTIGQLMVNPALYENLTATTAEVQNLLKDFRANPKKFLTIQLKLF